MGMYVSKAECMPKPKKSKTHFNHFDLFHCSTCETFGATHTHPRQMVLTNNIALLHSLRMHYIIAVNVNLSMY
jgi:hypothetical protein